MAKYQKCPRCCLGLIDLPLGCIGECPQCKGTGQLPEIKHCCPTGCGYELDLTYSVTGARPSMPDDFLFCYNCYAILRLNQDFSLRLSSLEESEQFGLKQGLEWAMSVRQASLRDAPRTLTRKCI